MSVNHVKWKRLHYLRAAASQITLVFLRAATRGRSGPYTSKLRRLRKGRKSVVRSACSALSVSCCHKCGLSNGPRPVLENASIACLRSFPPRTNPFLKIFERLAAFGCCHMRAHPLKRPMGRPSRQCSPRHRKCCHLCISKPSSNADMSEEERARTLHRIRIRSSWREYLHHTRRQTHHVRQVGDHANNKLACVRRELRRSPIRRYRLLEFFQWRAIHPLSQSRLQLGDRVPRFLFIRCQVSVGLPKEIFESRGLNHSEKVARMGVHP
ncbi:hypothetical protein EV658_1401 [Phaeovulum veldkampii DSM 11550]|nr:hypothetical protein EV658_1401 [Phaeovulum veldkampii DSM 11550]